MVRSRTPRPGGGAGKSRPPRKPYEIKRLPRRPYERQKAYEARKKLYNKAQYERRIARGTALGKTRQQARGKPPAEHLIRKMPPEQRKQVYAAIRAGAKREVEYRAKRAEIERIAAVKELYKKVKNIFTLEDEA